MKLVDGLIDYTNVDRDTLLLATTNNVITKNGLVMGRGNALAMKLVHPNIPREFGEQIQGNPDYGIVLGEVPGGIVGGFQTKRHWRSVSTLDIIENSTNRLLNICSEFSEIHLPFPGVNNGKLNKYDVIEVIHILPDNVFVYHN